MYENVFLYHANFSYLLIYIQLDKLAIMWTMQMQMVEIVEVVWTLHKAIDRHFIALHCVFHLYKQMKFTNEINEILLPVVDSFVARPYYLLIFKEYLEIWHNSFDYFNGFDVNDEGTINSVPMCNGNSNQLHEESVSNFCPIDDSLLKSLINVILTIFDCW